MREQLKKEMMEWLSNKANYDPEDQVKIRWVRVLGGFTEKHDYPWVAATYALNGTVPIIDRFLDNSSILSSTVLKDFNEMSRVHWRCLRKYIASHLVYTEKELNGLLFDHSLKPFVGPNGKPGWMAIRRFRKVVTWYAWRDDWERSDRVLSKVNLLLEYTGFKMVDFIKPEQTKLTN